MNRKLLDKYVVMIFIVLLFFLHSCTMASKLYPLPETGANVKGEIIYHNDEPFAELRYFSDKQNNIQKGVAIYYYKDNKEVWIFPKEGWSIILGGREYFDVSDIDLMWNRYIVEHQKWATGKRIKLDISEEAILLLGGNNPPKVQPVVFDVKMSEDGKYVYYKTSGFLGDSSHKYLVEYGVSE